MGEQTTKALVYEYQGSDFGRRCHRGPDRPRSTLGRSLRSVAHSNAASPAPSANGKFPPKSSTRSAPSPTSEDQSCLGCDSHTSSSGWSTQPRVTACIAYRWCQRRSAATALRSAA